MLVLVEKKVLFMHFFSAKGIFYIDHGHSFGNAIFYGIEFELFQFEVMLFCFLVLLSESFLFSILMIGAVFKV